MPNIRVPIESMRIGALPASDHYPRSPGQLVREMIDEAPRSDPILAYPPIRTCWCGVQAWLGSRCDDLHRREHGDAPGSVTPPPESVTAVTATCERCGTQVAARARYCSPRCRTAAHRARQREHGGEPG